MRNDEAAQIQFVQDRLTENHPEVPASTIAEIVAQARDSLAGAKVRIFVPLLVERRARIELSANRTRAAC